MNSGVTKVITGIRRCGKTCLPFSLFGDYPHSEGVDARDSHLEAVFNVECEIEGKRAQGLCRS